MYYLQNPPQLYELPEGKGIKKKQEPLYHPLPLTLHEIYHGGVKKMKIHRLVFTGEDETRTEIKEKILSIPIKPGLHAGTEIKFEEEGDQNPTQIPGIVHVLFYKSYRRNRIFINNNNVLNIRSVTWRSQRSFFLAIHRKIIVCFQ